MANSITIADDGAQEIKSDEYMLKQYQDAVQAILTTGQSYSISGSRAFTRADLEFLEKQVNKYEKRVLSKKGFTGRNHPDFSCSTDNGDLPQ